MEIEKTKQDLLNLINDSGYKPMVINEIAAALDIPVAEWPDFFQLLKLLEEDCEILITRPKKVMSIEKSGFVTAKMLSITKNGGYAALTDKSGDIFIQKIKLNSAMPSDIVLVRILNRTGRLPEAEVIKVAKRNFVEFTGTFYKRGKHGYVIPDNSYSDRIEITKKDVGLAHDKEKIFARIKKYAAQGRPATASIITAYGPAGSASSCCSAILDRLHIRREFPAAVVEEAQSSDSAVKLENRLDLRDSVIFTIDGASSKDLDDAVSIEKNTDGYRLGVHIADVSHYVTPGSQLDKEAYNRGTSIYFANTVIPMLPKELSNGICSLNPGEDRLTFSCFMDISPEGIVKNYQIKKSIIKSRVKGVYEEINQLYEGSADSVIREKYAEVFPALTLMRELAAVLRAARLKRGALDIETDDCEVLVDEEGVVKEIKRRVRGEAEKLIEEFMLCANESVASYASANHLPFIYRVHEQPEPKKIEALTVALKAAGISTKKIRPGLQTADMAEVIRKIADSPKSKALNDMVLRSLAKARYSPDCLGHFGLASKYYSHFTSPIRRYPDLAIHRILGDTIQNGNGEKVIRKYKSFVAEASDQSSAREVTAMQVEWDCEAIYKAEYMSFHIGEQFDGVISSIKSYGMYVELENTVEGLVRVEKLPGWFDYDEKSLSLICERSGVRYSIGDNVRIIVARSDVANGQIDFELI